MEGELKLHGHKRHVSKQILGGQFFGLPGAPYVDSEGYIYFKTKDGIEYLLNDKGERVKFREDDDFL